MHPQAETYTIRDTSPQCLVVLEGHGEPSQEIPNVMAKLSQIAGQSDIINKMTGAPMGVYYRDGDSTRWWMALPVADGVEAPEGTEIINLEPMKAAYWMYTGSYDGLAAMWDGCHDKLKADNLVHHQWMGEAYIDDPAEVPEETLRTTLWISLKS